MKSWILNLLLTFSAIISPVIPLMVTVGLFIAFDFLVAIYRAHKLNNEITSRKMGHTISKIFLYTGAVLLTFLLEKYILVDIFPASKIVAGLIILTETKSIDENFKLLYGYSFFGKLFGMIKRGETKTK